MRIRHGLRLLALLALVASAVAPAAASATTTVAPSALDFGSVPVGTTSVAHPVDLNVVCTTPDPVLGATCLSWLTDDYYVHPTTTGDFAATTGCLNPLGLGANVLSNSCTINVTFTPTAAGLRSGTLNTGTLDVTGLVPGPAVSLTGTGTTTAANSGTGKTVKPSGIAAKRGKCKRGHHRVHSAGRRKCRRHHAVV